MKTLPRSIRMKSRFLSIFTVLLARHDVHVAQYAPQRKGRFNPIGSANLCAQEIPLPLCQNLINPTTDSNNSRIAPPTVKIGRTICQPLALPIIIFHSRQFVAIEKISISGFYGTIVKYLL